MASLSSMSSVQNTKKIQTLIKDRGGVGGWQQVLWCSYTTPACADICRWRSARRNDPVSQSSTPGANASTTAAALFIRTGVQTANRAVRGNPVLPTEEYSGNPPRRAMTQQDRNEWGSGKKQRRRDSSLGTKVADLYVTARANVGVKEERVAGIWAMCQSSREGLKQERKITSLSVSLGWQRVTVRQHPSSKLFWGFFETH